MYMLCAYAIYMCSLGSSNADKTGAPEREQHSEKAHVSPSRVSRRTKHCRSGFQRPGKLKLPARARSSSFAADISGNPRTRTAVDATLRRCSFTRIQEPGHSIHPPRLANFTIDTAAHPSVLLASLLLLQCCVSRFPRVSDRISIRLIITFPSDRTAQPLHHLLDRRPLHCRGRIGHLQTLCHSQRRLHIARIRLSADLSFHENITRPSRIHDDGQRHPMILAAALHGHAWTVVATEECS